MTYSQAFTSLLKSVGDVVLVTDVLVPFGGELSFLCGDEPSLE